jgi:type IV secretion system protein VirB10
MNLKNPGKEEGLPEIAHHLNENKPLILVIIGIILIACVSFFHFSKSSKKPMKTVEENYSMQASPIEKLSLPQEPSVNKIASPAAVNPAVVQQQLEMIEAKKNELQQRLTAPLMLVNNAAPNKVDPPAQAGTQASDRNMQFMNQASAQLTETVSPTVIGSLSHVIAEGSLIHATLETATNSDLPGYVRAIVSQPSYSEDGSHVLIPEGSRLIGQYKSGMQQGQSRIFMVWTRLITPAGLSIQLGSPGVDSLGVAGVGADGIDRHFWARFGTGSLLSIIGVGAANAGVSSSDQDNSASAYQALQQDTKIPPTLTTYQGKPIIVFVAKDLNFQTANQQISRGINVF